MHLIVVPSPTLRTKCTNPELPTLQEALGALEIMREHDGIGISAPQIGSDKRFFWANSEFVVHPDIIKVHPSVIKSTERCLSLPGQKFELLRSPAIVVEYMNLIGQKTIRLLVGMEAVVFQHEFDHLYGVMIDEKAQWCLDAPRAVIDSPAAFNKTQA